MLQTENHRRGARLAHTQLSEASLKLQSQGCMLELGFWDLVRDPPPKHHKP